MISGPCITGLIFVDAQLHCNPNIIYKLFKPNQIWNYKVLNHIYAVLTTIIFSNPDLFPTVKNVYSLKYLDRYFSFSIDNVQHKSILLDTVND